MKFHLPVIETKKNKYHWIFEDEDNTDLSFSIPESIKEEYNLSYSIKVFRIKEEGDSELVHTLEQNYIYSVDNGYNITLYGFQIFNTILAQGELQNYDLASDDILLQFVVSLKDLNENLIAEGVANFGFHYKLSLSGGVGINETYYLVNDRIHIEYVDYYIIDKEHPFGAIEKLPITNVICENGRWTITKSESGGFDLLAIGNGFATIKVFYQLNEKEDNTIEFTEIKSAFWKLNCIFPNNSNNILVNDSVNIDTSLLYRTYDGFDNYDYLVEDYEISIDSYGDKDIITATVSEDKKSIIVTSSGEKTGSTRLMIKATYKIDGQDDPLTTTCTFSITVCDQLFTVNALGHNDELPVGKQETINLTAIEKHLDGNNNPLNTDITKDVKWRIEYSDSIQVFDINNNPIASSSEVNTSQLIVKRINNSDGYLKIVARAEEDGSYEDIAENELNYQKIICPLWFEGLEEDDLTYIYPEDKLAVTASVVNDSLEVYDENDLTYEWTVYSKEYADEDESSFEVVTEGYEVNKNTITFDGEKLHELIDYSERLLFVELKIKVSDCVLTEGFFDIGLAIDEYDPSGYWSDFGTVRNSSYVIAKFFESYIQNAQYPNGEYVNCEVTEVTIENVEAASETVICSLEEYDTYWRIITDEKGIAQVTVKFLADGETYEESFKIYVNDDSFSATPIFPYNNATMLPNSEMVVEFSVDHSWNYDNGEYGYEDFDDYEIEIMEEDGEPLYDTALFNIEVGEDGKSLIVKSTDVNEGSGIIYVWVNCTLNKGTEEERTYEFVSTAWVNIRPAYYDIHIDGWSSELGINDILEVKPLLYLNSLDSESKPNCQIIEDCKFELLFDPDNVEITDENGNTVSPKEKYDASKSYFIRRLNNYYSEIVFSAYKKDGNGSLISVTDSSLYVIPVYSISFEGLSDEENNIKQMDSDSYAEIRITSDVVDECEEQKVTYQVNLHNYGSDEVINTGYEVSENGVIKFNGAKLIKLLTSELFVAEVSILIDGREFITSYFALEIEDIGHNHVIVTDKGVSATCTSDGLSEGKHCSMCDEVLVTQKVVPAKGHKLIKTAALAPTTEKAGNSEYYTCSVCKKYFSDSAGKKEIKKDGWMINKLDKATTITLNKTTAEGGMKKTMQLKATVSPATADQKVTWTSSNKDLATVDANGLVKFGASRGVVTITAKTADGKLSASCKITIQFNDILSLSSGFKNAINWLADKGVVKGYDSGAFGQNDTCTRKQFAIMLYRFAGKPAVSGTMPFSDCQGYKGDSYKAILWASKQGIVNGYKDGTFGPDNTVTRQQVLIMLYRYAGKPAVNGSLKFTDINAGKNSDTYKAILWGSQKGITAGTSATTFSPNDGCKRRQIALFLYRFSK